MADKEIGELTPAAPLTGAEILHVIQGGNSRRLTTQDVADLAAVGGDGGSFAILVSGQIVSDDMPGETPARDYRITTGLNLTNSDFSEAVRITFIPHVTNTEGGGILYIDGEATPLLSKIRTTGDDGFNEENFISDIAAGDIIEGMPCEVICPNSTEAILLNPQGPVIQTLRRGQVSANARPMESAAEVDITADPFQGNYRKILNTGNFTILNEFNTYSSFVITYLMVNTPTAGVVTFDTFTRIIGTDQLTTVDGDVFMIRITSLANGYSPDLFYNGEGTRVDPTITEYSLVEIFKLN